MPDLKKQKSSKKDSKKEKSSKSKEDKSKSKKRTLSEVSVAEPSPKKQKITKSSAAPITEEVLEYRKKNMITVDMGDGSPDIAPFLSFDEAIERFPNIKSLLDSLCKGFKAPTSIQAQCWPIALTGRDLVGVAETGSGKTLGFLVPGIKKLYEANMTTSKKKTSPGILVLAPTRELAMQSDEVCNGASKETNIKSVCIAGGMDRNQQTNLLRKGAQVVFATPGRLISLMEAKEIDLSQVKYLVLDEADRMLDMGFEPDIKKIMLALPKDRQTAMFSATWPEDIRELASKYLKNPVRVTIGNEDLSACSRVTQIVEVVDPRQKDFKLEHLLNKYHKKQNRILIFCLYKKEAARVERNLQRKGWNVAGIHGDMTQQQRTSAFHGFRDGSVPLLVATDVASRGLDIPNVEYVINYTFPLTIEDYIHRIGRTGRANKTGIAHTLFTIEEKPKAGDLCKVLSDAGQEVPEELKKFGPSIKKKKAHALYGAHYVEPVGEAKQATRITFDDSD